MVETVTKVAKHSPWGKVQSIETTNNPEIYWVHTAGHGGLKLSRAMNARIPDYMRQEGGWYEEDCEWAKVAMVFPDAFSAYDYTHAYKTFRGWFPDEYEHFCNVVLKEGESHQRDERLFHERHKNEYTVYCAFGDWKEGVPKGMVGVLAVKKGFRIGDAGEPRKAFFVPVEEYHKQRPFGFVIDEARHQEWKGGMAA